MKLVKLFKSVLCSEIFQLLYIHAMHTNNNNNNHNNNNFIIIILKKTQIKQLQNWRIIWLGLLVFQWKLATWIWGAITPV